MYIYVLRERAREMETAASPLIRPTKNPSRRHARSLSFFLPLQLSTDRAMQEIRAREAAKKVIEVDDRCVDVHVGIGLSIINKTYRRRRRGQKKKKKKQDTLKTKR